MGAAVLGVRGLTERAVLPISLVLATLRGQYVDGLNACRHDAPAASPQASTSINEWLDIFIQASAIAVQQSETLIGQIER